MVSDCVNGNVRWPLKAKQMFCFFLWEATKRDFCSFWLRKNDSELLVWFCPLLQQWKCCSFRCSPSTLPLRVRDLSVSHRHLFISRCLPARAKATPLSREFIYDSDDATINYSFCHSKVWLYSCRHFTQRDYVIKHGKVCLDVSYSVQQWVHSKYYFY